MAADERHPIIGLVGLGNLLSAVAQGLLDSQTVPVQNLWGVVATPDSALTKQQRYGFPVHAGWSSSALQQLSQTNVLVLGVKPWVVPSVLQTLYNSGQLSNQTLIISVAAGVTCAALEQALQAEHTGQPVLRAMANTPCHVGRGQIVLSPGTYATTAHVALAQQVFSPLGLVLQDDESRMDAYTALVGSAPAFVLCVMEALSDGAVANGIPRDKASAIIPALLEGTAHWVRQTGQHPAVLKETITTPGGTTMAGLSALEAEGVRWAFIQALTQATRRAQSLG